MTDRFSSPSVALVMAVAMSTLAGCQPVGQGDAGQTAVDTAAILSAADSIRNTYEEAFNAGDTATLRDLLAPDVVYLPPQGRPITDREQLLSVLTKVMARSGSVSINSEQVKILGRDAVVEHGTETITGSSPNADTVQRRRSGFIVVLERTADGWKLARSASNWLDGPPSSGSGEM